MPTRSDNVTPAGTVLATKYDFFPKGEEIRGVLGEASEVETGPPSTGRLRLGGVLPVIFIRLVSYAVWLERAVAAVSLACLTHRK
jgi:hypothetical protein